MLRESSSSEQSRSLDFELFMSHIKEIADEIEHVPGEESEQLPALEERIDHKKAPKLLLPNSQQQAQGHSQIGEQPPETPVLGAENFSAVEATEDALATCMIPGRSGAMKRFDIRLAGTTLYIERVS